MKLFFVGISCVAIGVGVANSVTAQGPVREGLRRTGEIAVDGTRRVAEGAGAVVRGAGEAAVDVSRGAGRAAAGLARGAGRTAVGVAEGAADAGRAVVGGTARRRRGRRCHHAGHSLARASRRQFAGARFGPKCPVALPTAPRRLVVLLA